MRSSLFHWSTAKSCWIGTIPREKWKGCLKSAMKWTRRGWTLATTTVSKQARKPLIKFWQSSSPTTNEAMIFWWEHPRGSRIQSFFCAGESLNVEVYQTSSENPRCTRSGKGNLKVKFKFLNQILNWINWEKRLLNNLLNWIFLKKVILNNPLNWILSWNEWMNYILNQYLPFLMKSPLFVYFGHFLGTFHNRPISMIPELLNWIIFWIESWGKQYWIEYLMDHFLAKFKHWIESDRVSNALAIALLWLLDLYIYTAGGGNPLYRAELLKQCKKAKNITKKLMKTLRKVPKKFYFRHFFCVLVIYIYIGSQFWKKLDLACF